MRSMEVDNVPVCSARSTGDVHQFSSTTKPNTSCSHALLHFLFLGALEKFRKVTFSSVSFVCPTVRIELGSHWTGFHEIWYLSIFRKSIEKVQVSLKSCNNNGHSAWRPIYIFHPISLFLLKLRSVSDNICRNIQSTHFMFSNFFRKSYRLLDNADRPHCMMDTWGYKYILRLCTTYCFSTATMVARKRLSVTSYVYVVTLYV